MCMIDEKLLRSLLARAPEGTRIELGVFRGETLAIIADHPGCTIGVDSFQGMPAPGPRDLPSAYPKGKFAVGMEHAKNAAPQATLIKGFVPGILHAVDKEPDGYAFAHVDLDQYGPTLAALEWLAPRMGPKSIILCDDVFPGRMCLASGAVHDFVSAHGIQPTFEGRMAWWIVNP